LLALEGFRMSARFFGTMGGFGGAGLAPFVDPFAASFPPFVGLTGTKYVEVRFTFAN
jgi:hypothetical protein